MKLGAINFFSRRALIASKQLALSRHVVSSHTHLGSFDAASFIALLPTFLFTSAFLQLH